MTRHDTPFAASCTEKRAVFTLVELRAREGEPLLHKLDYPHEVGWFGGGKGAEHPDEGAVKIYR